MEEVKLTVTVQFDPRHTNPEAIRQTVRDSLSQLPVVQMSPILKIRVTPVNPSSKPVRK